MHEEKMINGKIWGQTEVLFNHNGIECHRIFIKRGYACSLHSHIIRSNAFFVESGVLVIETCKNDYNLIDKTIIKSNQSCIIEPGEFHKFKCLEENTVAYEIYWVEISKNDIIRENVGGKENNNL